MASAIALLPLLTLAAGLLWPATTAHAVLPPANSDVTPPPADARIAKLLRDADAAAATGQLKVALIHLKQAVLLNSRDGDIHARLGIMLLRTGQAVAAERELRQARTYRAPEAVLIPPLLQAMLTRGEYQQLLAEFPNPQQKPDSLAPDILRARAVALQVLGRAAEANTAMDRSLALRRDAHGLITRAQLASQQGDSAYGLRLATEAYQLARDDEDTLTITVLLLRQQGQAAKALTTLNEFLARLPKSVTARALRADTLLAQNETAKAKADADWIVQNEPDQPSGTYYQALVTARTKDAKAGWREAASLPPEFVQSDPGIALTVAQLAIAAGSTDSGSAILAALVQRHPDVVQARVELAIVRLSQNNPDLALTALEPLSGNSDPRVQEIIAQVYMRLGRYSEAITALQKATASGAPAREDILKRQLAQSELQVGETDKAIQELRQLAGHDPANVDTALQLAGALARAGKTEQALAEINRIAKRQPQNPLPAFYRGQILAAQGQLASASDAFTQSAAINPKFLPAFYSRASTAVARGSPEEAIKDLEYITAHDHANVPAWLLLAQIAVNSGRNADAVSVLGSAIKAAPTDPALRLALARYQIARRSFADAQASLSALLQVSPANPDAIALQGNLLFATGAKPQAVEKFRALVTKYPNAPGVQLAWANALNRVNNRIDAENAAAKAVELAPTTVQYRSALIALQIGHGKPVDALLTARAYRDLHPGANADLLLSGTLILLKREPEAEAVLEKSFAANRDPGIAVGLSQVELKLGRAKQAAEVLSQALQANPGDFMLQRQYATVLMETGDSAGARRGFEAALKQRPDDPDVLNRLARLMQSDDPQRAISLASLAVKIAPLSAPITDSLGWMKFQSHDAAGALPLLQRAHALQSANPEIAYHLALALDATGKREDAKALLKTVLSRNSKFNDAKNAQQLVSHW